jgi:uncharacterized protein (DUF2236 family)
VWATLVDTALVMYSRFVRPASEELEDAYYRDALVMGTVLGIPSSAIPADLSGFREYVDGMVADMTVSDVARALSQELFTPRPLIAALPMRAVRLLTAGLLPPSLRHGFQLTWEPPYEVALASAAWASRKTWPHLPQRLRRPPQYLMPPRADAVGTPAPSKPGVSTSPQSRRARGLGSAQHG